jgi:ribonuclease Z
LKLIILGSGSATPSLLRNPSAQILNEADQNYLIDCGEGTQIQLIKYKIKIHKIKNIFISHLHGDHYFGLIGLISSMNLAQRKEPLTIFGPKGLDEIITIQLKYGQSNLHFKLDFVAINCTSALKIFENEFLDVTAFPLNHRIPCFGYLFSQKGKPRNLIKEKLPIDISVDEILKLKNGENVLDEIGRVKFNYLQMTTQQTYPKKYAYCSDSAYYENIIDTIKNADILYHEATFKEDLINRATFTHHSTAKQAAKIAHLANVKKLIIGHFSSRYHDLSENLEEAKATFTNTMLAIDGESYEI